MLGAIIAVEGMAATSANHLHHLVSVLSPLTDQVVLLGGTEAGSALQQIPVSRGMSELGAVAAVLARAGGDHALVVAADLRWPSPELLAYMTMIRAGHEAVVPEGPDGLPQPLLAIYHSRVAGRAQGLAASGERNLRALLGAVQVRRVSVDEVAKFGEPRRLLERGPIA